MEKQDKALNPLNEDVMPACLNECYISINHYEQCEKELKNGYRCSRIRGHRGQHVACGIEHGYECECYDG